MRNKSGYQLFNRKYYLLIHATINLLFSLLTSIFEPLVMSTHLIILCFDDMLVTNLLYERKECWHVPLSQPNCLNQAASVEVWLRIIYKNDLQCGWDLVVLPYLCGVGLLCDGVEEHKKWEMIEFITPLSDAHLH